MNFRLTLGKLQKDHRIDIINLKKDKMLNNFSTVEKADNNSIVFVEKEELHEKVKKKNVGLIITNTEIDTGSPQAVVDNPRGLFFDLVRGCSEKKSKKGISSKAVIGKSCEIAETAYIGPFVIIEDNVVLGENVIIHGNSYIGSNTVIGDNTEVKALTSIYKNITIGKNCIIHSGVVVGADGYGYDDSNNKLTKIPQIGEIVIEDNVEIGANCTIDRATLGETLIKSNVKIDNLVQVAHNVKIGANTRIAAQSGIAGSSELGNWVVLAGQVGIGDHVSITDNVVLTAQSGVAGDIQETGVYSGTPARKMKKQYRMMAYQSKLEKMWKKIKNLEKKIENYEDNSKK
ncbi:MAG: UDP-3-O-(3-hydroxymyristoyl)glucosamine N-acyltransferase [Candidatus Mcinerneyibacterium aminivorans]|uniref:UDP-3-O-acylglucosamine N-acyltransferase n=1 Tax=Candidatus Mcinerneyibacterium aminivorans TaxID=2703815 RepID=A0A5D0MIW8_9BACT|nr:MAG: UDP-3-O-(3-hydroxymyristoyl)glucosamine N-acyltransferase [Candidatus Mcinerneyibacterium aminivorans]